MAPACTACTVVSTMVCLHVGHVPPSPGPMPPAMAFPLCTLDTTTVLDTPDSMVDTDFPSSIKTEASDAGVEEAMPPGGRKKREAEADPALFYSHSYGVHGARYVPSVYSHAGYGLGYAGYQGLGYTGYHGLGYAGYHGLPRTYVSGYAGYPYA